jgi:hypothetical protein
MINGSLIPNEKNMVPSKNYDIAISTQIEHERHSTHKTGSYSTFTKNKPSTSIYIPKLSRAYIYIS